MTPEEISKLPGALQSLATKYVGKKVLLIGDHPHADRTGIVDGMKRTGAGWGFEVKFNDGSGAGAFVFEPKHWRVIE